MDINDVQRAWFESRGVEQLGKLGFAPGQQVVDFGCGPGRFTVPLSRLVCPGGRVTAMDRNPEALEQLTRRAEAYGVVEAVRCVRVDDERDLADLPADSLDAMLVFDVLQHVGDWAALFDSAVRGLRPDGRLWVYPAAGPHPGRVDIDAVREALSPLGLVEQARHRLLLAHAGEMAEDEVYAFGRGLARGG